MHNRVRDLLTSIMTRKEASASTRVFIGMVLSLSIGFMDLAIDVSAGQTKGVALRYVILPLAVTTGIFFICYLALWRVIASRMGRFLKLQDAAWSVSLAVFIGIAFLFGSIYGLITFSILNIDLLKLFMVVVFSAAISGLGYFTIKAVSEIPNYSNTAVVFGLCIPFSIAEFALISSLPLPSLALLISFLFCALITFFLLYRLSAQARTRCLVVFFCGVFVLSALSMIGHGNTSSRGGFHLTEHKVKRVILITVDALRQDFVSAYDKRCAPTANIDGLANDGMTFTRVISSAPWTLPSFSSIMTGLSPEVHMTKRPTSKLPDNLLTLAGYMRDNGYVTGAVVFNPYLERTHGLAKGFMHYDVYPKTVLGNSFGARVLGKVFPRRFRQTVTTQELTDLVIQWMKANRGQDFFFWVHYLDPHMPYTPPEDFLPKGKPPGTMGKSFAMSTSNIRSGSFVPSLSEREWIKKLYGGEVLYVDKNLGRLFDTLKQLDMYDDSLIILTADHGEEFWEHGGCEHGQSLYNELLRVPLIIKLPFSSSKGRIDTMVETESVMPTILDLCGINYEPQRLSATSLSPLWKGNAKSVDESPIVSSSLLYYEDREGLIFDGMKYIKHFVTKREELYDLNKDPEERFNIANVNPEIIEKARDIMKKYHARAKDLRDYYQIEKGAEIKLDQRSIRELRSLGYVK